MRAAAKFWRTQIFCRICRKLNVECVLSLDEIAEAMAQADLVTFDTAHISAVDAPESFAVSTFLAA
jgi:hypothetical protein